MSLKLRLIISSLLILLFFIIVTGYTLDKAFYTANKTAMQEQLTTQLYLLMAATEIDNNADISMAASLLESKFSLPSSGLYAYITDHNNKVLWKSLSTIGISSPQPITLGKGLQEFKQQPFNGNDYYNLSYGVNWLAGDNNIHITFNIQNDLANFNQQIANYRTTLWSWLAGMAILLLIALSALLYWGLSPLRKVMDEVNAIENGHQETITGLYPPEIQVLTKSINELIEHAQNRQNRYKNALGDLAHSLKTPLAVIRGIIEKRTTNELSQNDLIGQLDEHISKIDSNIQYHLQRATTTGKSLSQKTTIKPTIERIISTLNKVHHEKNVHVENHLSKSQTININEDDALELFGNLLENAYKWCNNKVRITLLLQNRQPTICIEDDGTGINENNRQKIMQRGFRADSNTPGHGIGLAIVQDILAMYHSELAISQSDLGGAKICFKLQR
ncbi:Sensor protein PhoQ [hydrothermal vent metagenome]|uniref:histidine kinase n=1 Tax=hydrothermal vent metagenome TaxID=652676 RepID=A0A3B1ABR3_9ZZZZ